MPAKGVYTVSDISGGRNQIDPFFSPRRRPNQCVEALNIEWWQTLWARKRRGTSTVSTTFSAGGPFTAGISTMIRHVPSTSESSAELWAFDTAGVTGRMAGASTFAAPTYKDAISGSSVWNIHGASAGNKLFLAYDTAANTRMHCWDTSTVRRTGLAAPAIPTVANGALGATNAILRYYRVRYTEQVSGVTVRRSEPGPSQSWTPNGVNVTTVTKPAAINEGETHWELEESPDNVTFYLQATIVVGTTTYTDSEVTPTYSGALSSATGRYTLQPSYKFVASDGSRVIGVGDRNDSTNTKVEWSAVSGSLLGGSGDLERVDTTATSSVRLDDGDSGQLIGVVGPLWGTFLIFKERQIWQIRPTGDASNAFIATAITKQLGCIAQKGYTVGEDAQGNPCVYFLSVRGLYRYGLDGFTYVGQGIEDYLFGPTATINLTGTYNILTHMLWYATKKQLYFWLNNGGNDPATLLIYHAETNGWSVFSNPTASKAPNSAYCSCMFANTKGATMSSDLKPHSATGNNKIFKLDTDNTFTDVDGNYQSAVLLAPAEPWGGDSYGRTDEVELDAELTAGSVTLHVRSLLDSAGTTTAAKDGTTDLLAVSPETSGRVGYRVVEDSDLEGVRAVQFQVGEVDTTQSSAWAIHRLVVPFTRQESL